MSLKVWAIIAIIGVVSMGGYTWFVWNKGFDAGKAACQKEQEEYKVKVKKDDAKIDSNTPFNADRDTQLGWLRRRTTRQ